MKALLTVIEQDTGMQRAVRAFAQAERQSQVYGVTGSQKSVLLAAAYAAAPRPTVLITSHPAALEGLRADLTTLLPDVTIVEFPAADMATFMAAAKGVELAAKRLAVLSSLLRGEPCIVLATAEAAMQKVVARDVFAASQLVLENPGTCDREDLLATLLRFGYERVDQVERLGQFSARGGIIDIFPLNAVQPIRLELFGDEIDSLRQFDSATQRSLDSLERAVILPVSDLEHAERQAVFLSYLAPASAVIWDEPSRIREQLGQLLKENPELKQKVLNWSDLAAAGRAYTALYVSLMLQKIPYAEPDEIISVSARGVASFHRQLDLLQEELQTWQERQYRIFLCATNSEKATAIERSLQEQGITAKRLAAGQMPERGQVGIKVGVLGSGFELPGAQTVVLTEKDIMGRQKKKPRPRVAKGQQISYFRDINVGDYVVHANHGIGKYLGVETLQVGDIYRDYLHIRYAGDDKLYVPTDQVHLLQKYIGNEGEAPRLHRMGGSDWLKTKTKAKKAVADMAKELLALYAERQLAKGLAFPQDTTWQAEFEDAFPYEETPDQLAAIREIKRDMENERPMDRLLCGDVGFGKTEVAVRAAFKAVMGGKQVAVLVPTTVLAQQHYQTFSSRFSGFAATVDVVSRFRSAREQKDTLQRLKDGQVDVLIGTHRILQADVQFKDLGLLIVDEEQRFGVKQKEKMKKWSAGIDVLTLSATPIPRTLHMSLVGARDMSIIETPPEERFPVQSYVLEYQEALIREAIKRELKRGGQVYFVYNRVQTIDKMQRRLAEMLPDAKIKVAHGQMPEELLEQVMLDFYEGEDDVLVCTSIIENGLDVPNANTIIVYDADRFGLSQLYQMRGRVGRSHRMAFAYFTYRPDKVLTEVAEKRLQAIKEFAELGAGFKIAMRDLEIRGAGNLLGAEQHGHIISVGFEMYCRLLEEAVEELRTGRPVEVVPEPLLELQVEAYICGDYIADAMQKMEMYQRIAAVRQEEHISELMDEMIDRFGEPPQCVLQLLAVARLKNLARALGIASILQHTDYVDVTFGENPLVQPAEIMALERSMPLRVKILAQGLRLKTNKVAKPSFLSWLTQTLTQLLPTTV